MNEVNKKNEVEPNKPLDSENFKKIEPEMPLTMEEREDFIGQLYAGLKEIFTPTIQAPETGESVESPIVDQTVKIDDKPQQTPIKQESNMGEKVEGSPIQNKIDGLRREAEVENDLRDQYPAKEGYLLLSEEYLRDASGKIATDPAAGKQATDSPIKGSRRIDFIVLDRNGNVVKSIEVTSKDADKEIQIAKEDRIREAGGSFIRCPDGTLAKIPDNIQTQIERRE